MPSHSIRDDKQNTGVGSIPSVSQCKNHQFLQNMAVKYATYQIILNKLWFHFETQRGHIFLFPCTPSFLQCSIWRKVRVTVTKSTVHSASLCHSRTLGMREFVLIFLWCIQRVPGFCVLTIKLLPWHLLEIRQEECRFCQQLERETGWRKFTSSHSLCVYCDATRF